MLVVLIALLGGCAQAPDSAPGAEEKGVGYYHDVIHRVSCWTFGSGGGSYTAAISCLPDNEVTNP